VGVSVPDTLRFFLPHHHFSSHSNRPLVQSALGPQVAMRLLITWSILCSVHYAFAGDFNYDFCKAAVQNGTFGSAGIADMYGHPLNTTNTSLAEGYLYDYCRSNCGSGCEYNSYLAFSNQASLWFIPWFSLVAQIPFYTTNARTDALVMFLAIGSPTTALHSLFVTIHNRHWLQSECTKILKMYPDQRSMLNAIYEVLGSLHQYPLEISDVSALARTVALRDNRIWWEHLRQWFVGRRRRMEASAYAQLVLTVMIYGIAVLPQAFGDLGGRLR
jgi:hypothetical protein